MEQQPFFIVGMGRSGSTLLWSLLERHPRVALTKEGRFLQFLQLCHAYALLPSGERVDGDIPMVGMIAPDYNRAFADAFEQAALDAVERFYRELFAGKEYTHWGDQIPFTPAGTVLNIQHHYPRARFVVLVRDPRDWLCSIRSFGARENIRVLDPFWARLSPRENGAWWQEESRALLTGLTHRLLVPYESLVGDPGAVLAEVGDFLGLPDLGPAAVERLHASHGTSASPQRSIGRWREELTVEDAQAVMAGASPLAGELDYR